MIDDKHLDRDAKKALADGESVIRNVRGADGRVYERQVEPNLCDLGGVTVSYTPIAYAGPADADPAAQRAALSHDDVVQSLTIGVADIGVWAMDLETGQSDWDDGFRRLTGLSDDARPLDDDAFTVNIFEEDRLKFVQEFKRSLANHELLDIELRFNPPERDMIWLRMRGELVEHNGGTMIVGIIADVTERKHNKERSEFMIRELDHRVKNLLAIILSIAEITARSNSDIETYKQGFRGRLESMARTHNLLAQAQWSQLDLCDLVEEEVCSFATTEAASFHGPAIALSPTAAQSLAMFLHELTANAFKHGALSRESGRVKTSWSVEGNRLLLVWEESGGPVVTGPSHEGFGSKVINRIIKRQLGADVTTDWDPQGFKLTAVISMDRIVATQSAHLL